ncbi:heterokaryon incompatibility protein-domain-containing protein [Clohesyomyces aquaticus]|uniref:Heterokaryon incompatibility protein-domain-containing protein n=1 Tax=Clohesyomyces aquaticus TaxID=1231657 RepID=A0A1Y2A3J1_9PLEO|nr:heterokaryon incompatibility protein-domain-containing protein [Clohesyomyces aquaticus]
MPYTPPRPITLPSKVQGEEPYTSPVLNLHHQEIRILELLPGGSEHDSTIQCKFQKARLVDKPCYVALSYTWGAPAPTREISLDGNAFTVRNNLYQFLRTYRSYIDEQKRGSVIRYLWVDAICINQNDTRERNHQVALMKSIYSSAHHVVIWLGQWEDGFDAKGLSEFAYSVSHMDFQSVRSMSTAGFDAILALLQRQYWSRIWIVQEVVLAQSITLFYGNWCCDGPQLDWFLLTIENGRSLIIGSSAATVLRQRRKWHKQVKGGTSVRKFKTEGFEFYQLLEKYKDMESSDPRDKVYALLSLTAKDDLEAFSLEADYSKAPFQIYEHLLDAFQKYTLPSHDRMEEFARLLHHVFGWNYVPEKKDIALTRNLGAIRLWERDLM